MEKEVEEVPQPIVGQNGNQKSNSLKDIDYYKKKPEKKQAQKRKSEYQYNVDAITEDTEIPLLPKKNQILPQPKIQIYRAKEKNNRDQIQKLIDKKKEIRTENYHPVRKVVKGEQNKFDLFRIEIDQIKQLRQRLTQVKARRKIIQDNFNNLIKQAQINIALLKKLRGSLKGSREHTHGHLQQLQHRLATDQLTKQQEKQLHIEILNAKRQINQAQSIQNLQAQLIQAEQKKQHLDYQIDKAKEDKAPLDQQYTDIKKKIQQKNIIIDKLKLELQSETTQKTKAKQTNSKQWEQWKENKKNRINQIDQKIKKLEQSNKKIWDQYYQKKDAYYKQKDYINFIEWQTRQKNKKINQKIRKERQQQQQKKNLQKQKQQQFKKYIKQIQTCNFLISYCSDLYPKQEKNKLEEPQKVDVGSKIAQDQQWKKQKGVEILKSKKTKEDDDVGGKKKQKNKKKKQEKKQQKFEVPFNIIIMFETIKVLPPESVEDIQRAVKDLKERQQLFSKACKEQVNQNQVKTLQEIKANPKKSPQKKINIVAQDFPQL